MKTQIEYERKFLLTGMPKDIESWDKLTIRQFYVAEDDKTVRYRVQRNDISQAVRHYRTVKTFDGSHVQEEEQLIEYTKFDDTIKRARANNALQGSIFKERYTRVIDGLTWDVDKYVTLGLFICECEVIMDSSNDPKKSLVDGVENTMPQNIRDVLLMELTNDPRFSARNFACRHLDPFNKTK